MARIMAERDSSTGVRRGEGAGAADAGERRREKRRQERKRKIFWTKKCIKISVLSNSYLRLHGDPCWSTAVA